MVSIEKNLNEYLSTKKFTDFAVGINGSWGSGKTFFIKKWLESRNINSDCYISLFGIKESKDISKKIFEHDHPTITSPMIQILLGVMSAIGKVDHSLLKEECAKFPEIKKLPVVFKSLSDAISAANDSIQENATRQQEVTRRLLILDDIERCPMDRVLLFGTINDFLTINHYKIILIYNKEEMLRANENEGINNQMLFENFKKVIGRELYFQPDCQKILENIYKNREDLIGFLVQNNLKECAEILRKTQNNLRRFNQVVWDYEFLLKERLFPESAHEYSRDIFLYFLLLGCYLSKEATPKDFKRFLTQQSISEDDGTINELYELLKDAPCLIALRNPFNSFLWYRLLRNQIVTSEEIDFAIINYQNTSADEWLPLWKFHDLEQDQLNNALGEVKSTLAKGNLGAGGLLQLYGTFQEMLEKEFIDPVHAEPIIALLEKNIDETIDRAPQSFQEWPSFHEDLLSFMGYAFHGKKFIIQFMDDRQEKLNASRIIALENLLKIRPLSLINFSDSIHKASIGEREHLAKSTELVKFLNASGVETFKYSVIKILFDALVIDKDGRRKWLEEIIQKIEIPDSNGTARAQRVILRKCIESWIATEGKTKETGKLEC